MPLAISFHPANHSSLFYLYRFLNSEEDQEDPDKGQHPLRLGDRVSLPEVPGFHQRAQSWWLHSGHDEVALLVPALQSGRTRGRAETPTQGEAQRQAEGREARGL